MLFDGFTVCAQLVNFLLLVWLLKRFLYRPILAAIDTREKLIATQLQDAEQQKAVARKERQNFQEKNETFEAQREALLKAATEEVASERLRLLAAARAEAEALRAGFSERLRNERLAWQREIVQRTQHEVFAIAGQALKDLANADLEDQIVCRLLSQLQELDAIVKAELTGLSHQAGHPILVCSAFTLSPPQREAIQAAIKEALGIPAVAKFETASELVCGIELRLDGHKITWTIADYLAAAEQNLIDLFPEPAANQVEQHAATAAV